MRVTYKLIDGTEGLIENVREFFFAYYTDCYTIWHIDEDSRMRKVIINYKYIVWLKIER